MMIVIQLMNSLKFVTQSKGVYQFVKEEETSPTHNLSDPHSKEGDGSREGTWRTSTLSGRQLVCSPSAGSMGCDATRVLFGGGRRRRPSTVGVTYGPDIEGPLQLQRRMDSWAGGSAGLHRPAVSQGHGGGRQRMAPSARVGARLLWPSAQQGNGGKGPQRRPAARGFFGRWQRGAMALGEHRRRL